MHAGPSNKNAASSLKARLDAKRMSQADEAASVSTEAKAEEAKAEENAEESADGDAANGTQDVKAAGDEDGDGEHAGQGVLLGKRGHSEEGGIADKFSRVPSGREKMSVDGEQPPVKRVPASKDEDDSVMALWSELTDNPNVETEAGDIPADGDAAEVRYRLLRHCESSLPGCQSSGTTVPTTHKCSCVVLWCVHEPCVPHFHCILSLR